MHELPRLVAGTLPGKTVTVKVLRKGKEKTFTATLTEMKPEMMSQAVSRKKAKPKNPPWV